jgi:hypothetical protein
MDHQVHSIIPAALYAHSERSPVPVSLTQASRAQSKVPSRLFNLQLAYGLTSSAPPNQLHLSPAKTNFTPPLTVGCLKDGFLLPNFGVSKAVLNTSISQSAPLMKHSTGDTSRTHSRTSSRGSLSSQDSKTVEHRSVNVSKKSKHKYPKMAGRKSPTITPMQVRASVNPHLLLNLVSYKLY